MKFHMMIFLIVGIGFFQPAFSDDLVLRFDDRVEYYQGCAIQSHVYDEAYSPPRHYMQMSGCALDSVNCSFGEVGAVCLPPDGSMSNGWAAPNSLVTVQAQGALTNECDMRYYSERQGEIEVRFDCLD